MRKLLSVLLTSVILATSLPVYANDVASENSNNTANTTTNISPADSYQITLVGQWVGESTRKEDMTRAYTSLSDKIGAPMLNGGLFRSLAKNFLGWSDKPQVENGAIAKGARLFTENDEIGKAFPNGIPSDAKLYAVYLSLNPLNEPFDTANLWSIIPEIEGQIVKNINKNKLIINGNVSTDDILLNTPLYTSETQQITTKNNTQKNIPTKVVDVYSKKDDVNSIHEIVLKSEFEMDDSVAMLVYKNPAAYNPLLSFNYDENYKNDSFNDLQGKEAGYTHVDLVVKLQDDIKVPDTLYLNFKSYSWRPIYVYGKNNQKLSILNPNNDVDLGKTKDSFTDLVKKDNPNVLFGVKTEGNKEITVRTILRHRESEKITEDKIIPQGNDSIGETIIQNMELNSLTSSEVKNLRLDLSEVEVNKRVVSISDAKAKELADTNALKTIGVSGIVRGHMFVNSLVPFDAAIDNVNSNTLELSYIISAVKYKFESKTKDKELPKEVLALLPLDTTTYGVGEMVKAISPKTLVVNVDGGKWTFLGYAKDSLEMTKDGIEFVGQWEYSSTNSGGGSGGSSSGGIKQPKDLIEEHIKYIEGYPDGTVRPNRNISRAEVTTIYYRLLKESRRAEIFERINNYADVISSNWYNKAVSSMTKGGYVEGYPDGTFGGNKAMTRAEFVAITSRFMAAKEAKINFSDVKDNHWAKKYIETAAAYGWVEGYPDGTFRPNQEITRAEAMTIINRLLNRGVGEDGITGLDYIKWPDNEKQMWYYYEVIEATNDHKYTGKRPSEKWSTLKIDYVYDIEKYERPNK